MDTGKGLIGHCENWWSSCARLQLCKDYFRRVEGPITNRNLRYGIQEVGLGCSCPELHSSF